MERWEVRGLMREMKGVTLTMTTLLLLPTTMMLPSRQNVPMQTAAMQMVTPGAKLELRPTAPLLLVVKTVMVTARLVAAHWVRWRAASGH